MSASYDRLLLAAILLLVPSAVDSFISTLYPGGLYFRTPLYCDSNSRYTTLKDNTACFHQLTKPTCCMKTYTKSDNGVIHQECLCGASNNETPGVASTQTITKMTTTASLSSASTTTLTSASTSTTTATPTTTTRTPSTTATFRSLCSPSSFRLMNGDKVDNHCQYSGIANITQGDGSIQTCNAAYTRAKVSGVLKPTFFTSSACIDGIRRVNQSNIKTEIQLGNQVYPLTSDMFRLVEGPNRSAFIDILDRYARLLTDLDTCQKLACPYNKDKMAGILDFNDCKIVSWGASSTAAAFTHAGLHEAAIKLIPDGCSHINDFFGASNTLCFKAVSGAKLFSMGDSGAPIYCRATSNSEWILVGVAAEQLSWGATADLKVIPYPE